jgi:hypothetical protein
MPKKNKPKKEAKKEVRRFIRPDPPAFNADGETQRTGDTSVLTGLAVSKKVDGFNVSVEFKPGDDDTWLCRISTKNNACTDWLRKEELKNPTKPIIVNNINLTELFHKKFDALVGYAEQKLAGKKGQQMAFSGEVLFSRYENPMRIAGVTDYANEPNWQIFSVTIINNSGVKTTIPITNELNQNLGVLDCVPVYYQNECTSDNFVQVLEAALKGAVEKIKSEAKTGNFIEGVMIALLGKDGKHIQHFKLKVHATDLPEGVLACLISMVADKPSLVSMPTVPENLDPSNYAEIQTIINEFAAYAFLTQSPPTDPVLKKRHESILTLLKDLKQEGKDQLGPKQDIAKFGRLAPKEFKDRRRFVFLCKRLQDRMAGTLRNDSDPTKGKPPFEDVAAAKEWIGQNPLLEDFFNKQYVKSDGKLRSEAECGSEKETITNAIEATATEHFPFASLVYRLNLPVLLSGPNPFASKEDRDIVTKLIKKNQKEKNQSIANPIILEILKRDENNTDGFFRISFQNLTKEIKELTDSKEVESAIKQFFIPKRKSDQSVGEEFFKISEGNIVVLESKKEALQKHIQLLEQQKEKTQKDTTDHASSSSALVNSPLTLFRAGPGSSNTPAEETVLRVSSSMG